MTRPAAFLLLSFTLTLTTTSAAAVTTITDCETAPVAVFNGATTVTAPGEDVVIQCALSPLPGTSRIMVAARTITVDGPRGGAVSADGKALAVSLMAETRVVIDRASVAAENRNGDASIHAGTGVRMTADTHLRAGELLRIECVGPACTIDLTGVTADANRLEVLADGTITVNPRSHLMTHGPTDLIRLVSSHGDVLVAGGVPVSVPMEAEAGARTGMLRSVLLQAQEMCPPCGSDSPNRITGSLEGNLYIEAPTGRVALTATEVTVGENIDIAAATLVDMTSASLQNCGPKTGKFRVAGTTCSVDAATLLDDDPDAAPTLACAVNGTPAELGTCTARR